MVNGHGIGDCVGLRFMDKAFGLWSKVGLLGAGYRIRFEAKASAPLCLWVVVKIMVPFWVP